MQIVRKFKIQKYFLIKICEIRVHKKNYPGSDSEPVFEPNKPLNASFTELP
jgi:hypothetical protein